MPHCSLDSINRRRHSALDEAIRLCLRQPPRFGEATIPAQLTLNSSDTERRHRLRRHQRARAFRIFQRLLEAGASTISIMSLDDLIRRTLDRHDGQIDARGYWLVAKLVRVVSSYGHRRVASALLGVLVYHEGLEQLVTSLVISGAWLQPRLTLDTLAIGRSSSCASLCVGNVLVMLRAFSDPKIIEYLISHVTSVLDQGPAKIAHDWEDYYRVLRMLIVAGCRLPVRVQNYLYQHHADAYGWMSAYIAMPRSLGDVTRYVIRKYLCDGNVFVGLQRLGDYPESLKRYVMFEDM